MDTFDVLVIGGGPGGYLCAERAAQGGLKTAIFEKRFMGGTCLNEGCIPTKTLLNSSKLYRHATESADYGVTASGVSYDHARVIERKGRVVKTLVSGVEAAWKTVELCSPDVLILVHLPERTRDDDCVWSAVKSVTERHPERRIVIPKIGETVTA